MGATVESWPAEAAQPKPVFSTFVLTVSDASEKVILYLTLIGKFRGQGYPPLPPSVTKITWVVLLLYHFAQFNQNLIFTSQSLALHLDLPRHDSNQIGDIARIFMFMIHDGGSRRHSSELFSHFSDKQKGGKLFIHFIHSNFQIQSYLFHGLVYKCGTCQ
jgi:hypothetical protein